MSVKSIINLMNNYGAGDSTPVFIIAGQSNARGNTGGVAPVLPYVTPNVNAQIAGVDLFDLEEISNFQTMDYNSPGGFLGIEHGVEASIAYNYSPNNIKIVKVTRGGSSLAGHWGSGSTQRNELINYINYAKNNTNNPVFYFYWNQWESDVVRSDYTNAYESNYQNLINDILGSTGIVFEKHIINKVNVNSSFYSNNTVFSDIVIQAQINNAALYNAEIYDSSSYPLHDAVHHTSQGYLDMGDDLYNNYLI